MDFVTVCQALSTAISTTSKLRSFLQDDLAILLNKLGKTQYKAAIRALDDMSDSSDFERELQSAVTLLRSSYEMFISAKGTDTKLDACGTAMTIAACYRYLNEPSLVKKYCEKAYRIFFSYSFTREMPYRMFGGYPSGVSQQRAALNNLFNQFGFDPLLDFTFSDDVKPKRMT
jgi:hypothetical protein